MDPLMISGITGLIQSIVSRVWPDKSEQEKLRFAKEMQAALQEFQLANSQIEVNKEEAKNSSVFVSGWRPFIGWVCGASFAWMYVGQPVLTWLYVVSGHTLPVLPTLDSVQLMTVLAGMLGLGGFRTIEKIRGR